MVDLAGVGLGADQLDVVPDADDASHVSGHVVGLVALELPLGVPLQPHMPVLDRGLDREQALPSRA